MAPRAAARSRAAWSALVGAALEHGYGRLTFVVLGAYRAFVAALSFRRSPD